MAQVDIYASHGKSVAVASALNDQCHHASPESYLGFHVSCSSTDATKRTSMAPYENYCILHALMVRDQTGTFVCPAGLDLNLILETASKANPKY